MPGLRARAPIAPLSTEAAIEKVVAASAGVKEEAQPREESPIGLLASRLSFELSNPPEASSSPRADAGAARAPLPAARVLDKAREEPVAPSARPDKAKAPAVVAVAKPSGGTPEGKPEIQKQVRQPTSRDQAEDEFRKASAARCTRGGLPRRRRDSRRPWT